LFVPRLSYFRWLPKWRFTPSFVIAGRFANNHRRNASGFGLIEA
jgi:hypothetical protein